MNLNIEIPDALEAALKAKAHEQGVNTSGYARQVLERALSENVPQKAKAQEISFRLASAVWTGSLCGGDR